MPAEWTAQLRRGLLELCILKLLQRRPTYGYELIGHLSNMGPLGAGENTVYPLLRRLRNEGALETYSVRSPTGPPRQHYRVTAEGATRLRALDEEWRALVRTMAMVDLD